MGRRFLRGTVADLDSFPTRLMTIIGHFTDDAVSLAVLRWSAPDGSSPTYELRPVNHDLIDHDWKEVTND